jgi:hypothetical protein
LGRPRRGQTAAHQRRQLQRLAPLLTEVRMQPQAVLDGRLTALDLLQTVVQDLGPRSLGASQQITLPAHHPASGEATSTPERAGPGRLIGSAPSRLPRSAPASPTTPGGESPPV